MPAFRDIRGDDKQQEKDERSEENMEEGVLARRRAGSSASPCLGRGCGRYCRLSHASLPPCDVAN